MSMMDDAHINFSKKTMRSYRSKSSESTQDAALDKLVEKKVRQMIPTIIDIEGLELNRFAQV
jgi:hypothetical protein